MIKWEYKRITKHSFLRDDILEVEMNVIGRDGWELVSILKSVLDDKLDYWFKRPTK